MEGLPVRKTVRIGNEVTEMTNSTQVSQQRERIATKTCPNLKCLYASSVWAASCENCGWDYLENRLPRLSKNRLRSVQEQVTIPKLLHGDCVQVLRTLPDHSVDLLLTDPPYPCIKRDYGTLTEQDWQILMTKVVSEARRVLKPNGSAVFILQPNSVRVGRMRSLAVGVSARTAKTLESWCRMRTGATPPPCPTSTASANTA